MVELIKIGTEQSIAAREKFLTELKPECYNSGVLLQTCNRVEWYRGAGEISSEVMKHLFRVVSGLDSSLIGETAIVNQVKTAYQEAVGRSKLDKSLHKLFQTALHVGKRVRKETGISEGAMSHSQAVVHILQKEVSDFSGLNFTLIGVNKLNEKIIQFLVNKGARTIFIGNRTYEKAAELAEKYNSVALRFDSLAKILIKTDVLISATSAPHYVITPEKLTGGKPSYVFDLAVPRDVDPVISTMGGVRLFDVTKVEAEIKCNVEYREEKSFKAEQIIDREVDIFSESLIKNRRRA